jgi:Guanylate kinase
MIKKLFLIDGLAGTGKNDLIDFIEQKHHSTSTVVYKYTTRTHRNPEEAKKTDLMFVSREDFESRCDEEFYHYSYADGWYGFSKKDVADALNKFENVFVIIRSRDIIAKLTYDFSRLALVIPIFIYTDRSLIIERLKSEGFSQENINFRLQRSTYSWNDYLEYPDGNIRVIINNSDKSDFHRKINSLIGEFSMDKIDLPNYIYINPHQKFELIKPLVGFKQDIKERLERFPYEKNIFLMMKFRKDNEDFSEFIKTEIANAGFNCVRADDAEWNITKNVYNPLAVLYCCKFGIALFDQPEEGQNYSPNVAYELGIMHYQGKNVLLLTHSDLPQMPFDLIKDLRKDYYKEIDFRRIFTKWLKEVSAN